MLRAFCELIGLATLVTGLVSLVATYFFHVTADTGLFSTVFATSVITVLALDLVRHFHD